MFVFFSLPWLKREFATPGATHGSSSRSVFCYGLRNGFGQCLDVTLLRRSNNFVPQDRLDGLLIGTERMRVRGEPAPTRPAGLHYESQIEFWAKELRSHSLGGRFRTAGLWPNT